MIRHTDPHFVSGPGSVYYIGVYGQAASNFSIQVTSSYAALVIRDGVPVRDQVPTGMADYFSYEVTRSNGAFFPRSNVWVGESQVSAIPSPGSFLTFSLTALSGDPDLFVSTVWPKPGPTTNQVGSSFVCDCVLIRFG